jgi:hypothetical protein
VGNVEELPSTAPPPTNGEPEGVIEVWLIAGDEREYFGTLGTGTPKGCRKPRACILDKKTGEAYDPVKFWEALSSM